VDDTLFVADATLPLVHVIDLSNPVAPVEKNPLVLTKRDRRTRAFGVPAIAVGPVTRRYTRPLYAVDGEDGAVDAGGQEHAELASGGGFGGCGDFGDVLGRPGCALLC
jgi:hypothetical protein